MSLNITRRFSKTSIVVVSMIALLAMLIALFWPERPQIGIISFPFSLNPVLKLVSSNNAVFYESNEQTSYLFLSDLPDEECSGVDPSNYSWENFPIKVGDFVALMQGKPCEDNSVSFVPVDPSNGALVYKDNCEICHGSLNVPNSANFGPWLGNIHSEGAERIPDTTAAQYVYESIVAPNNFIASGCANEKFCQYPSAMPVNFMIRFSSNYQDLVDLLGYLLVRQ